MPRADWYADPVDPGLLRYWDGTQWSAHVAPAFADYTPPPADVPLLVAPGVEPDMSTERLEQLSSSTAAALSVLPPPTLEPGWYADPSNQLQARVWDGTAWTGRVARRPLSTIRVDPLRAVPKNELGRAGAHWPSAQESRFLAASTPTTPGWYLDPLAPAQRARRWDGVWSEEVRRRRDLPEPPAAQGGSTVVRPGGYGDPEDIARTGRSLVAWAVVGVLFVAVGIAGLLDPRQHGGSLLPVLLGAAALVRAYVAHAKLRDLDQR